MHSLAAEADVYIKSEFTHHYHLHHLSLLVYHRASHSKTISKKKMYLPSLAVLATALALPLASAQPAASDPNTNKGCFFPAIIFTSFDYVFNLTAVNYTEHTVNNKPLRLLRTPDSAEVTPVLGGMGDLVDFGFKDGHLSIIGGRLAYSLPTIEIFPPVLVPWRFDLNVEPREFYASYSCDRKGKRILVLRPSGAEGKSCREESRFSHHANDVNRFRRQEDKGC